MKARLSRLQEREEGAGKDELPPFTKLRGILKGKVHFTDEEIEAAKIRARDIE